MHWHYLWVWFAFAPIALPLSYWDGVGTCNETSYTQENYLDQMRITSMSPGNYVLQGLFTITQGKDCATVDSSGLMRVMAFKHALDEVNMDPSLLPDISLGFQIDNVCRSLPVTMARGIEVVSLHRPNSVCRASFLTCDYSKNVTRVQVKPATAVIGTGMSFTTIPLASLLSLYYVPQISYAASSRLLSKKELYKSFFRTIPSDKLQILVMLDIVKSFGWNYVFAVGADDDYGKLGVTELKQQSRAYDICVSRDEYIPYQSTLTRTKVKQVVDKIEEEHKAKVVVLFLYLENMGDLILQEAANRSLERIWLTSEAWNPSAETAAAPRSQKQGILTVGFKLETLEKLDQYVHKAVARDAACDVWLKRYINQTHKCLIHDSYGDTLLGNCTNGVNCTQVQCSLNASDVAETLLNDKPGNLAKLVDAVKSVAHGIHSLLGKQCTSPPCKPPNRLNPQNLTNEMFNVNFLNDQNFTVAFNDDGDPKYALYTIVNLQYINGTYKYVQVGTWHQSRRENDRLQLNKDLIQWPMWTPGVPRSVCSNDCLPGKYVVGKTGCCWGCDDCEENSVSNVTMAQKCTQCAFGYHTIDKIVCVLTPVLHLKPSNPAGLSILVLSCIGIVFTILAGVILYKLRDVILTEEPMPSLLVLSIVILAVTFCYGPLHVLEPTDLLCQGRNSFFFVLFMLYAGLLLTKTNFITSILHKNFTSSLKGNMFAAQCLFLLFLIVVELAAVIVWLRVNPVRVELVPFPDKHEKWMQCEVEFTASRLVATFLPCVLLIIATFCAFRERNMEHAFYEPKFISFTCIALCIIIVAFLPTFKYVVGIYKAIVMAFTVDVCGYTYMACLIVPKIYIAVMYKRNNRGQPRTSVSSTGATANVGHLEPAQRSKESESFSDISTEVAKESHKDVETETTAEKTNGHANHLDDGGVYKGPAKDMEKQAPQIKKVSMGQSNESFEGPEQIYANEEDFQTEL